MRNSLCLFLIFSFFVIITVFGIGVASANDIGSRILVNDVVKSYSIAGQGGLHTGALDMHSFGFSTANYNYLSSPQ